MAPDSGRLCPPWNSTRLLGRVQKRGRWFRGKRAQKKDRLVGRFAVSASAFASAALPATRPRAVLPSSTFSGTTAKAKSDTSLRIGSLSVASHLPSRSNGIRGGRICQAQNAPNDMFPTMFMRRWAGVPRGGYRGCLRTLFLPTAFRGAGRRFPTGSRAGGRMGSGSAGSS